MLLSSESVGRNQTTRTTARTENPRKALLLTSRYCSTRITWGYAPNTEVWCLSHLTLSLSLSNWYQWRMWCTSPSEICRTENAVCCFSSISKKPPCILGWRKIRQDMDLRSSALVSRRQEPLKMRFNLHSGHLSFWVHSLSSIQTQWLWISSDL